MPLHPRPVGARANLTPRLLRTATAVLLTIPFVALLAVGVYARVQPRLLGFPFFYWYQLLWVPGTTACIWLASLVHRYSPVVDGGAAVSTPAAAPGVNAVALGIVVAFFLAVSVGGFVAVRWRRPTSMSSLNEWGLGGRRFGSVVTWFLLGGDLYTAYTFVAVPAALFAAGAVAGFFAVPATLLVYPLLFVIMPRMWAVARTHGYVTAADFIRGRYDSRLLALAVSVTGIVATMPYIALQLVGIQSILDTLGVGGTGSVFVRDLPLLVAFAVLAAYTYSSGLRAPALIAFVKDTLIYLVVAVSAVYFAVKIGYGGIFAAAQKSLNASSPSGAPTGVFVPASNSYWAYGTLVLGAALAQLMYPHSMTAVLSAKSPTVIRRNAATLPVYTLMLGLLALLGFVALARHTSIIGSDGTPNPQLAVPHLFAQSFPSWFLGIAFAAIAIGALVPAAIMSIAAANLFTRNIYSEYLRPHASAAHEARVAKLTSLVVKFGALAFILFLDRSNAVNLQLLGGIWILQTCLGIVVGLYTRWLHRWAVLAGWAVAMDYGTAQAYQQRSPTSRHFGSSLAEFPFTHTKVYIALTALTFNVTVTVLLTLVLRALGAPSGHDATCPADYRDAVQRAAPHIGQPAAGPTEMLPATSDRPVVPTDPHQAEKSSQSQPGCTTHYPTGT